MIKFSSNDIFWILFFLYRSLGVEKTNYTFIRACGSLENRTRYKAMMVNIYTRFQTKTAQKPYSLGGTYLYSLYRGVPRPPGIGYINFINGNYVYHCKTPVRKNSTVSIQTLVKRSRLELMQNHLGECLIYQ